MNHEADITWDEDDAPYSVAFGDRYYSKEDGFAECLQVFMQGNDLPGRWRDGKHFHIAELGFGTGLNFLVTLDAWRKSAPPEARLTYSSFELTPLSRRQMQRALAAWPQLDALAHALLAHWPDAGERPIMLDGVQLQLILGDAATTLPAWDGMADAWYLDGFAPSKNPQLWSSELMQAVYDHTRAGGSFSTYTAAGFVRRNLLAAGFAVEKVPGFKGKRERLQGRKPTTG